MRITLARNATLLVEVPGLRILVDPMLGAKGSQKQFRSLSSVARNPLVELTLPVDRLTDVDVVAVTHTHSDHWDLAAASLLRRDVPVIAQNETDEEEFSVAGFSDVRVAKAPVVVAGATFTRTGGRHGSEDVMAVWGEKLGQVSGYVISHPGEPTLYIAGDTVLTDDVRDAIESHSPDIIVLNTGEARFAEGPLIMGAVDIGPVHEIAPNAQIVAVHMEALNHCTVGRDEVRDTARLLGISSIVHVPEDGEAIEFPAR